MARPHLAKINMSNKFYFFGGIFYLLDQMLILFLYENRKKLNFLISLSSLYLRYVSVKCHFWVGTMLRKTGD